MSAEKQPADRKQPAANTASPGGQVAAIGPRVHGVIESIRADRVSGWAIDRSDSAAALEIDVLREGRVVATVHGDRHRADLERAGIGTGRYGFSAAMAPPVEPGFEFTVAVVARTADGTRTVLKRAGDAAAETKPDRRLLEATYEEIVRLRRGLASRQAPAAGRAISEEAGGLAEAIGKIEVVQARIEAALAAIEPQPSRPADRGLKAIIFVTLAIALGSLGFGLLSFWQP